VANLGICVKCDNHRQINRSISDGVGRKLCGASIVCNLSSLYIEWDTDVPEDCPFRMEHLVTEDAIMDLAEEATEIKEIK
jgi:hypothetical protein